MKKIFLDKNKLKECLGAEKVIENDLGNCELYVIKFHQDEDYLVFVFQGRNATYFKVMRPFVGRWSCDEAIYHPEGLFGFMNENLELKVKEKLKRLYDNGHREI